MAATLQLEPWVSWISNEGMISLTFDANNNVEQMLFYDVVPMQEPFLVRMRRLVGW